MWISTDERSAGAASMPCQLRNLLRRQCMQAPTGCATLSLACLQAGMATCGLLSLGSAEAAVSHHPLYMYGQHEQSPQLHTQNPLGSYDCTLHLGMVSMCIETDYIGAERCEGIAIVTWQDSATRLVGLFA